jgi:hypothetical protein
MRNILTSDLASQARLAGRQVLPSPAHDAHVSLARLLRSIQTLTPDPTFHSAQTVRRGVSAAHVRTEVALVSKMTITNGIRPPIAQQNQHLLEPQRTSERRETTPTQSQERALAHKAHAFRLPPECRTPDVTPIASISCGCEYRQIHRARFSFALECAGGSCEVEDSRQQVNPHCQPRTEEAPRRPDQPPLPMRNILAGTTTPSSTPGAGVPVAESSKRQASHTSPLGFAWDSAKLQSQAPAQHSEATLTLARRTRPASSQSNPLVSRNIRLSHSRASRPLPDAPRARAQPGRNGRILNPEGSGAINPQSCIVDFCLQDPFTPP